MLAEFSVFPLGGLHMSEDVARAIRALENRGLTFRLGPLSTTVEGDWDEVLEAIRACHEAVAAAHPRVITTIKIDDRRVDPHHLDEMVRSVEQKLLSQTAEPVGM